jgi:uncharacterized repeat protein (TIGR03803 family)
MLKIFSFICGDRGPLLTALFLALTVAAGQPAHAQTLTTLYTFTGGADGANPYAGVILDSKGDLYGTTEYGGASNWGTVFELMPSGNGWTETVLHSFTLNGTDGVAPLGSVMLDPNANLYGTTQGGGAHKYGTVFEVSANGTEQVLYSFGGLPAADGGIPYAGVVRDTKGNLYGTTDYSGPLGFECVNGCGTVFEIAKAGGETVLYGFLGEPDGGHPFAGVIFDANGNLYGTTYTGGSANCHVNDDGGCGTVFELTPSASGWTETVLYRFTGGTDGANPGPGSLIFDEKGNLYGTTLYGGDASCAGGATRNMAGCGTVFKLTPSAGGWTETVLHRFSGGSDGEDPVGLVLNGGTLYGTTFYGGAYGAGTVFEITKAQKGKVIYTFCSGSCMDGAEPNAGLIYSNGYLYGTTEYGGAAGYGTVFQLNPRAAPPVALTPASAAYAKRKVNTTSPAKTFTLANNQTVALTGIAIATTGDFAVSDTTCTTSLAAKKKCTISVTFTPTETGTRTGQLTVSDSGSNSPQAASLTGTGD